MTARKRLASPVQKDLTESRQRAKSARTPVAKAVTKRVAETKERAYSGKAPRKADMQLPRSLNPAANGTRKPAKAVAKRKGRA